MQKFAEKYWEKSQPGKEVDENSYRLSQQQNISVRLLSYQYEKER
jgi:hypothetical protein